MHLSLCGQSARLEGCVPTLPYSLAFHFFGGCGLVYLILLFDCLVVAATVEVVWWSLWMTLLAIRFAFENELGGAELAIGLNTSVRMMIRRVSWGCLFLGIVLSYASAFWES